MKRPRRLKVYGWGWSRHPDHWRAAGEELPANQVRALMAAPSKAAVARALDIPVGQLWNLGETGNPTERIIALSRPEVMFWSPLNLRFHGNYYRFDTNERWEPDESDPKRVTATLRDHVKGQRGLMPSGTPVRVVEFLRGDRCRVEATFAPRTEDIEYRSDIAEVRIWDLEVVQT